MAVSIGDRWQEYLTLWAKSEDFDYHMQIPSMSCTLLSCLKDKLRLFSAKVQIRLHFHSLIWVFGTVALYCTQQVSFVWYILYRINFSKYKTGSFKNTYRNSLNSWKKSYWIPSSSGKRLNTLFFNWIHANNSDVEAI